MVVNFILRALIRLLEGGLYLILASPNNTFRNIALSESFEIRI